MKTSFDAKVVAAVAGFVIKSSAGLLLFAVDRHTNHTLFVWFTIFMNFDLNFHCLTHSHLFLPQPNTQIIEIYE